MVTTNPPFLHTRQANETLGTFLETHLSDSRDELAAAMLDNESGAQNLVESTRDDIYRRVLQRYGFARLTKDVREVLDVAWNIARSNDTDDADEGVWQ